MAGVVSVSTKQGLTIDIEFMKALMHACHGSASRAATHVVVS